jgi:hypothetical protein
MSSKENTITVKPTDDPVAYHEHLVVGTDSVTTCRLTVSDAHAAIGKSLKCICGIDVKIIKEEFGNAG